MKKLFIINILFIAVLILIIFKELKISHYVETAVV